ncbi:ATP-binding protein [Saccharothrix sp. NRRL B-16314]|uniref:ATP-binding protein n=1 Tax=Saccharothrix sp. NRRL B-16314 TaxID=1463825 RepID=UPI0009DE0CAF|nr:biotin carboxylase N-terminal domain-containing protein [Saccharothrix sp. NRRL B-16314]
MRSVLIAARGTPAVRAVESCRALGLVPVTVVARSDPQRRHAVAGHVVLDDTGCGGYGCVDCVVRAAEDARVDAVHPGPGAVAENPLLARKLAERGIRFVGPPASALAVTGDKGSAAEAAERVGVPVLPHAVGERAIRALVDRHGLPVVLKRSDLHHGDGVRVVRSRADLTAALGGYSGWYAELYVEAARVVGVTVAADDAGHVVRLDERESLLVAGNRKLLEAAPVLGVPDVLVRAMRADAVRLACALGLRNLATVEFLVHPGGYAFLEVNARLTGSYRICEARTGIDLIALQLRLAMGHRLGHVVTRGTHVAQAHLFVRGGKPGLLTGVRLPGPRPGVVVDCALDGGLAVVFDTITSQVLATGSSRAQACDRVGRAVADIELAGLSHHGPDIADWCSRRSGASTEDLATT